MKVPLTWLAEFVELPADPIEIASRLTATGLKVEKIHKPGGGIDNIFVGEVVAIAPHPNADNLVIVDVTVGDKPHKIVCGAKNFSVGDLVPVALVGATLPGDLKIERRKIRGEESDGMLCSARELGLGDDHSGILVLGATAVSGMDVRDVLGLNDTVFELEISPNRPDAMSIMGVAREVAACYSVPIKVPVVQVEEQGRSIEEMLTVRIEDEDGCHRYLARAVTAVTVGPSPDFVQYRLLAAGVRPVSNVVDATNYALLVTGHPMHAFDLDKVGGQKIVVRTAKKGEKITTLDGVERELNDGDLVIADDSVAIGIAGVMGGLDSEVSSATSRIVLESAYFNPRVIFRTAREHALRTEASQRFERGADITGVEAAATLACRLILDHAGGEIASGSIDIYPRVFDPKQVSMRTARARSVLGADFSDEEMVGALSRLDLGPSVKDGVITVTPPARRHDIALEEDLVEEVARVIGYDRIPTTLPHGSHRAGLLPKRERVVRRIRSVLAGAGLFEAKTSSLIGPDDLANLEPQTDKQDAFMPLTNPLNQEESILRPTLIPGLMRSVVNNIARRNLEVRMFEIGRCFLPSQDVLPFEPLNLGIVLAGATLQQWYEPSRDLDFFDLKGVVKVLLDSLLIEDAHFEPISEPPFHQGRAAALMVGGKRVGTLGELRVDVQRRYDLTPRANIAEIQLDRLLEQANSQRVPEESGRFPAVLLDIAITVPREVLASDVIDTAKSSGGEHLESVRLFDVYTGEQVEEGRKSLALGLSFRSSSKTLTEDEAIKGRDAIASALEKRHSAKVRA